MVNGDFKSGDLIGFRAPGLVAQCINIGTGGWPWSGISHIGIIGEFVDSRTLLFESTSFVTEPCAILKRKVKGVQSHTLESMLERPGAIYHYPLYRHLTLKEEIALSKEIQDILGRRYDYLGASRVAGRIWQRFHEQVHSESLDKVFCSEMCFYLLKRIGVIPGGNASAWSPNALVRSLSKLGIIWDTKRIK